MGYINKNTSGLINTRLTDTARLKLSQGTFNIAYFQIGDSEVSYNTLPVDTYSQFNTFILEPSFNAQNSAGAPQSNKENIKYPLYVDGSTGNTYGIPFMDSTVSPIFNRAAMRGFFSGNTTGNPIVWSALTNTDYVINSNYTVQMNTLNGTNQITLTYDPCSLSMVRGFAVGDLVTILYDGEGSNSCYCPPVTPSPTPSFTPAPNNCALLSETSEFLLSEGSEFLIIETCVSPTTLTTTLDPCASPTPTPTPTATFCPTPTPSRACPPQPKDVCTVKLPSCYPILTYRIVDVCLNTITLDRETPDYSFFATECYGRVLVYPPNMTSLYDTITPSQHWSNDVINFESICYTDQFNVNIWNMNIPWSESPAGLDSGLYKDYTQFGSVGFLGTKEYFGYASSSGQTTTSEVYYNNSFGDRVVVTPEEQKAISIIHYTNQTIDLFYGEKFALEPFDDDFDDTTGQARNFRLHLPWLMWHKNPECCFGETFYVDPPNFDGLNLFTVQYIKSSKNLDMNNPGIRYYNLWDTHMLVDGFPSRVGKVFPDQKLIVIDDEEIIAAMSYKANRNWTLPAPKLSLITPNTCGDLTTSIDGLLTGNSETLYVTYRFSNSNLFTNSLHSNYYVKIQGPNISCNPESSQNVGVRFGGEFGCLNFMDNPPTTTTTTHFLTTTTTMPYITTTTTLCPDVCVDNKGFFAETFQIICQKVQGNERPVASEWKIIDFTDQLNPTKINGLITQDGLTGNTFVITPELYDNAPVYDLNDYISLTPQGFSGSQLNFGDEYYFYGNLETDIQATIYEMRYKVNLSQAEFLTSSNPTWTPNTPPYMTEVGLYDSDKNLMIISKLQSPVQRQGIQQLLVKFDF